MDYGSLFTGIGGFDIALSNNGFNCVWQCEKDPHCQTVLKNKFGVEIFDDVKKIQKGNAKPINLICGGFPCQDLSIAGKRKGLDGERSGLWFEFARIIKEFEPEWCWIENVPGLLSSNAGKDFAIVIGGLTGIIPAVPVDGWQSGGIAWGPRYKIAWRVFDSQYFGLAQRRRRLFIIGNSRNGSAAQVLFESSGMQGDYPADRKEGQDIAYTLRSNPSHSGDKGDEGINTTLVLDEISPTICAETGNRSIRYGDDALIVGTLDTKSGTSSRHGSANETSFLVVDTITSNGDSHSGFRDGEGLIVQNPEICGTVSSKWAKGAGWPAGDETYNLVVSPLTTRPYADNDAQDDKLICLEMAHASEAYRESGDIAPSLQARMGTGGNQVPMVGVRRLMPIECERLQGFPDNWTGGQSDTQRYKQCGNAVSVNVVEWMAIRIKQVSDGQGGEFNT